jgi:hypothetical protein
MSSGSRLGIDVGGVLSQKIDTDDRRGNLALTMLRDAPTKACIKVVSALVSRFGADNVFILSKCGAATQRGTIVWLNHYDFFAKTGLRPDHVVFCVNRTGIEGEGTKVNFSPIREPSGERMRELCKATGRDEQVLRGYFGAAKEASAACPLLGGGCGKGVVAKELRLTHFIDDRIECLHSVFFEGWLTTKQAGDFATVSNRSAMLLFGSDEELPADAAESLGGIAPSKQQATSKRAQITTIQQEMNQVAKQKANVAGPFFGGVKAGVKQMANVVVPSCFRPNQKEEEEENAKWVGPCFEDVNAMWKQRLEVHRACVDWDVVARYFNLAFEHE